MGTNANLSNKRSTLLSYIISLLSFKTKLKISSSYIEWYNCNADKHTWYAPKESQHIFNIVHWAQTALFEIEGFFFFIVDSVLNYCTASKPSYKSYVTAIENKS